MNRQARLVVAEQTHGRPPLAADGMVTAGPVLGARGGRCNLKANRIPDRPLGQIS